MTTLVPILGDQLSRNIASLAGCEKASTTILMMELWDEATYVRHHKQKLVLVFSAMRHFAAALEDDGWSVDYIRLDDDGNTGSFTGEVKRAISRHQAERIRVVEAGEWRVAEMMSAWKETFQIRVDILPDDRFLCTKEEFYTWAQSRDRLLMENFYREMRRRTGLLMDGGEPEGGQWNYDKENRAGPDMFMAPPPVPGFPPDKVTREVVALVERRFGDHFGSLDRFRWPVTAKQAAKALDKFIAERLPEFGTYQDAMAHGQDDLFHALLSTSINLGLLDPLEVCRRAERAYRERKVPLNAAEGFIRQIIGWREYIRGMYWFEMPELREANALNAQRPLPEFYWTGETDMRCLADCIRSTRENAHAHHIQRLMVLGNFALITGVHPQELQDWFLVVYADAYEWVELPNVSGMALWADQGRLASKPYAASGNYINRMSDYCSGCRYDVGKKTGDDACPFNSLYWHFLVRHRKLFEGNMRINRVYGTWDKMDQSKREAYLESAETFLANLPPATSGRARN
ncbi:cryptochrome/photolyase family protein [Novosphingobium sp. M1R2S20]|uniref:Cryptochrome/photolyase family protein n=1 Tax=Novosphingobium rhizovicinum TaxID=3228928 RepID=A0ABV3RG90_9SPHN